MLPPTYGMLKMVLDAYRHKAVDDIALVPMAICYDAVLEEGVYSKELAEGSKGKGECRGSYQIPKVHQEKYWQGLRAFCSSFVGQGDL